MQTKHSREATILDKLADRHGIAAEHVAVRADLLAPFDIEPAELDGVIVREAQRIHTDAMFKIHERAARINGQL